MRLIDADALIKESYEIKLTSDEAYHCVIGREKVLELIQNAPTVERPTGEWIPLTIYNGFTYWECSECGEKNIFALTKFCFHCGAKMMKGEAEI